MKKEIKKENNKEELREKLERELGYISSIFMSQECKGTEMVMPTTELFEAADRIELYFFEKQQKIIQAGEALLRAIGKKNM